MKLILIRSFVLGLACLLAARAPASAGNPSWSEPDLQSDQTQQQSLLLMDAATAPASQPTNSTRPTASNPDELEITEFLSHFSAYEPMYFVAGTRFDAIKFNFSLRYHFLNPPGPGAQQLPLLERIVSNLNFAYSQTSLWDVSDLSQPHFVDSSYRPEIFYDFDDLLPPLSPGPWSYGVWAGFGHESNGLEPPEHRSMNIAFIRPALTYMDDQFILKFDPKFYDYINDISQNPDIARYRGYCDIRMQFGEKYGWQLATLGRVGDKFDRGSIQLDLTCPFANILKPLDSMNDESNFSLDVQYFDGYGDTLMDYNKRNSALRIGFSLLR